MTDPERGEVLCGGCGLVLLQGIEEAPGGRAGAPPAGGGRGPATVMGGDVDSSGRAITGQARQAFGRLRVWDRRSRPRSAAGLAGALAQLGAMAARLGVPAHVAEDAAGIYRRAAAAGLTRGRAARSVAAASLYAACREGGVPRALGDVAAAGGVERRAMSRDLRQIVRALGMALCQYDAGAFVVRIANNLGARERAKREALSILRRAEAAGIGAGKNPVAQAAAALYVACARGGEGITQRGLSREAGVSDVTVRGRAALLRERLGV